MEGWSGGKVGAVMRAEPPFGVIPPSDDGEWDWYLHLTRLYAAMILGGQHFAEASYGDGEWFCILGYEGKTARGQVYNPKLRADLIRTLMKPTGQWCCYWGHPTKKKFRIECDAWLRKHRPPVVWFARRSLPAANCNGQLWPLFRALKTRKVILVGPPHHSKLDDGVIGKPVARIELHPTDAWRQVDAICNKVSRALDETGADCVLFSGGMAAPVMVHKLWGLHHKKATFWDIGAILDPYCGVFARKHYRLKEWQEGDMLRNLT